MHCFNIFLDAFISDIYGLMKGAAQIYFTSDNTFQFKTMTFPRQEEEESLSRLLGNTSMWTTPFIFIFGQQSCGKSEVLQNVLNRKKVKLCALYLNLANILSE